MKLVKMHGTGNDFLFVNLLEQSRSRAQLARSEFAKKVCNRHFGVGADGLAFLEPHASLDFQWDFYNSDGSHAEMCGNAARCAALLYSTLHEQKKNVCFATAFGAIEAQIEGPQSISLQTGEIQILSSQLEFKDSTGSLDWKFVHLETGVPHAVVEQKESTELQSDDNRRGASELRFSPQVGPRGSNVTFFKPLPPTGIAAVSFERGVEDFTLACGTGVIAAAYVHCQKYGLDSVAVSIPGGDLEVDFQGKKPTLRGPAKIVAEIELDKNFLD